MTASLRRPLGLLLAGLMSLCVGAARAQTLSYEPVGLGWTHADVARASAGQLQAIAQRAERQQRFGCARHCERLQRIFDRLVAQARAQSAHAASLPWTLTVVRLHDVDAIALPGGQVLISEDFIDGRALHDDALAFVLAHEMAHSILEHERQALSFARLLLPRQVPRSVRDMYTEIDHNFALLKAMEPVLQQGEFEADELGLLLASSAGFAPQRQLDFMATEAAAHAVGRPLMSSHPAAAARLEKLRERLPLALRLLPAAAAQ